MGIYPGALIACAYYREPSIGKFISLGWVVGFAFDTLFRNAGPYFSLFLRHTGAVSVWTVFPLYLQGLGAIGFRIGFIYAINPGIQFLVMRRLDSFRDERLILAGYLLSCSGFVSYFFALPYLYIIPGMFFIAFSWAFLYVGSTRLVIEQNLEKATAAGLINSMIGAAGVF
ncbi:MAG: MFS transporter, partial [Methanosarcinaceae archaeon]|nr:MFS transporter [Methanosarcinaceae archaeon]